MPLGPEKALLFDRSRGIPYLEGLTPYCTLAVLKAEKLGYAEAEKFIQTDSDGDIYSI